MAAIRGDGAMKLATGLPVTLPELRRQSRVKGTAEQNQEAYLQVI